MSGYGYRAMSWALNQRPGSAAEKLTLIGLAIHADHNGVCYPSQETLARDTLLSIRTVRRALSTLVSEGFVQRTKRAQEDGRQTDLYKLNMAENNQPASMATSNTEETSNAAETNQPVTVAGNENNKGANARETKQQVTVTADPTGQSDRSLPVTVAAKHNQGTIPNDTNVTSLFGNELPPQHKMMPNVDDAFTAFWTAFPKRVGSRGKPQANKKFKKLLKSGISAEHIINGAKAYARQCEETGSANTKYVSMAITWLNNDGWADYDDEDIEQDAPLDPEEHRRRMAEFERERLER